MPEHNAINPDLQQALQQAAIELCEMGKILYQRNWSPATSSNYSIRINDTLCAITSSGRHKGQLQPNDIMLVDWQGQAHSAGKPSAETLLHTQIYQRDPGQGAVLHTHSATAALLSQIWPTAQIQLQGWELQKALQGETTHEDQINIPIFANNQNIAALAQQVEQHMQSYQQGHAYLIKGHGIYTWGKDLTECFRHLEALEHLLEYQLQLLTLGRHQ